MNVVRSAGGSGRGNSLKLDHEHGGSIHKIIRPTCTISELMRKTKFSKDEIRHFYRTFKQDCPSGEVSRTHFSSVYGTLFPSGDCARYAAFLFQNIDRRNTGYIRFEDLIVTLSILSHGSIEDRLNWIFDMYDVNKDGMLTRTELAQIVASVFQLIVPLSKLNLTTMANTIEEQTDRLFCTWDLRGCGIVYKQDFVQYCLQDQTIRRSIEMLKLNLK